MKPFCLAKAKAGEPLVTRDGRAVTDFHHFPTCNSYYQCMAVIDGERFSHTTNGHEYRDASESPRDLFMAPKKRTLWLVLMPDSESHTGYRPSLYKCVQNGYKSYPIEIEE